MAKFKYFFSLFSIILITQVSVGQNTPADKDLYAPKEVKEPLVIKGIKLGLNVGRFSDFLFKPERMSSEASFDINISNKYFGVIEGGMSEITIREDSYNYISEGSFIKAGVDFNLLKKHPSDFLGIGVRLGRASFDQSASNIIYEDIRWPGETLVVNSKSFTTYWAEVSFGIKGELIKNVYFGWSALVRIGVSGRESAHFQPYDIPGFGKGANSINLGANYYIYYQIPFNKKK